MDFLISAAQAAPAVGSGAAPFSPLLMLLVFGAVFYFMVLRPQIKRGREHRDLLAGLAKGDEVLTSGGMAGRVEDIGDAFVTVEIAPDVRIKLQKQAISAVLPKGTLKAS